MTLSSLNGDLTAVVFLPDGLKPDEPTYYYSSRFDHGSMIGAIRFKKHVLFGDGMWRVPHNSNWPESGIGLASEFGVGDDGSFCYYRCGWQAMNDVTNGLLGYREAKLGESFLKIGVGELIKGACPICDSTEDYRFNSPYIFRRHPDWKIAEMSTTNVRLEHQAMLNTHGYKLIKNIELKDNVLSVTSTLTNLGAQAFSTAWYAHNFFTCDGNAVGPGYSATFNLKGMHPPPLYEEPGTWSWSTPLKDYGKVTGRMTTILLKMVRALDPGVRIKTEFVNDGQTDGGFTIGACDVQIESSIPEIGQAGGVSMYAYNMYVERGTFSPEPQILIQLQPGQTTSWTQRLVFSEKPRESSVGRLARWRMFDLQVSSIWNEEGLPHLMAFMSLLMSAALLTVAIRKLTARRDEGRYDPIPEAEVPVEVEQGR